MAEYIEREALFKAFEKAAWYNNMDRDNIAEELLMQIPAADVAPVVHGRWIPLGWREIECGYDKRLKCSVCGWTEWYHKENYCPNCGARMQGGSSE